MVKRANYDRQNVVSGDATPKMLRDLSILSWKKKMEGQPTTLRFPLMKQKLVKGLLKKQL